MSYRWDEDHEHHQYPQQFHSPRTWRAFKALDEAKRALEAALSAVDLGCTEVPGWAEAHKEWERLWEALRDWDKTPEALEVKRLNDRAEALHRTQQRTRRGTPHHDEAKLASRKAEAEFREADLKLSQTKWELANKSREARERADALVRNARLALVDQALVRAVEAAQAEADAARAAESYKATDPDNRVT